MIIINKCIIIIRTNDLIENEDGRLRLMKVKGLDDFLLNLRPMPDVRHIDDHGN